MHFTHQQLLLFPFCSQGCQTLGDLPSFNDVHTKFGGLTEFVNDQKHKLKNVCNKEKEDLCSTLTKITGMPFCSEFHFHL